MNVFLVIIIIVMSLVMLGQVISKKEKSEVEYLMAGRSFGKMFTALSLAATDIGMAGAVGTISLTYFYGISGAWWCLSAVPAWIFLGKFFVKRFKKENVVTVPEYFEKRYSVRVRILGALLQVINSLIMTAVQLLLATEIIYLFIDVPKMYIGSIVVVFFIMYTTLGGLRRVMWTNILSYIMLFLVGGVIVLFLSQQTSIAQMISVNAIEGRLSLMELGIERPIVWILMCFYWYASSQYFIQKILASKDKETAEFSYVFTGVSYIIYTAILVLIGMQLFSLNQTLASNSELFNYFYKNILSDSIRALILAAFFASTISKSSAYMNACATIVTVDFYKRFYNKRASSTKSIKCAKITTIVTALVALWFMKLTYDSMASIVFTVVLCNLAVFFPLILGLLTNKIKEHAVFYSIVVTEIGIIMTYGYFKENIFTYSGFFDPIIIYSIVSLFVLIGLSRISKGFYRHD